MGRRPARYDARVIVLTQYFYEQMMQFEKDPASLKDTIGEMVYSMDVDQQVHRARQTDFDKEADEDVLQHSKPRQLTALIWPRPGLPPEMLPRPAPWRKRCSPPDRQLAVSGRRCARPFHPGPCAI